mgnify:CR=1 FL=1
MLKLLFMLVVYLVPSLEVMAQEKRQGDQITAATWSVTQCRIVRQSDPKDDFASRVLSQEGLLLSLCTQVGGTYTTETACQKALAKRYPNDGCQHTIKGLDRSPGRSFYSVTGNDR